MNSLLWRVNFRRVPPNPPAWELVMILPGSVGCSQVSWMPSMYLPDQMLSSLSRPLAWKSKAWSRPLLFTQESGLLQQYWVPLPPKGPKGRPESSCSADPTFSTSDRPDPWPSSSGGTSHAASRAAVLVINRMLFVAVVSPRFIGWSFLVAP